MTYLIDTDFVVDYLKGKPESVKVLTSLINEGLAISIITYGEIYEGIYFGRDPKSQERGFLQFLRGVGVLLLNRAVMKNFALIRGNLRKKGEIIGDPDIMIAATASENELILLTRNKKDFQKIAGLELFSVASSANSH